LAELRILDLAFVLFKNVQIDVSVTDEHFGLIFDILQVVLCTCSLLRCIVLIYGGKNLSLAKVSSSAILEFRI